MHLRGRAFNYADCSRSGLTHRRLFKQAVNCERIEPSGLHWAAQGGQV